MNWKMTALNILLLFVFPPRTLGVCPWLMNRLIVTKSWPSAPEFFSPDDNAVVHPGPVWLTWEKLGNADSYFLAGVHETPDLRHIQTVHSAFLYYFGKPKTYVMAVAAYSIAEKKLGDWSQNRTIHVIPPTMDIDSFKLELSRPPASQRPTSKPKPKPKPGKTPKPKTAPTPRPKPKPVLTPNPNPIPTKPLSPKPLSPKPLSPKPVEKPPVTVDKPVDTPTPIKDKPDFPPTTPDFHTAPTSPVKEPDSPPASPGVFPASQPSSHTPQPEPPAPLEPPSYSPNWEELKVNHAIGEPELTAPLPNRIYKGPGKLVISWRPVENIDSYLIMIQRHHPRKHEPPYYTYTKHTNFPHGFQKSDGFNVFVAGVRGNERGEFGWVTFYVKMNKPAKGNTGKQRPTLAPEKWLDWLYGASSDNENPPAYVGPSGPLSDKPLKPPQLPPLSPGTFAPFQVYPVLLDFPSLDPSKPPPYDQEKVPKWPLEKFPEKAPGPGSPSGDPPENLPEAPPPYQPKPITIPFPNIITPQHNHAYPIGKLRIEWEPIKGVSKYKAYVLHKEASERFHYVLDDTTSFERYFGKHADYTIAVQAVKDTGEVGGWKMINIKITIPIPEITRPELWGSYPLGKLTIKWNKLEVDHYLIQLERPKHWTHNFTTSNLELEYDFKEIDFYSITVAGVVDGVTGEYAYVDIFVGEEPPTPIQCQPPQGAVQDGPHEIPQKGTQDGQENDPQGVPHNTPQDVPEKDSQDTPQGTPEKSPQSSPQDAPQEDPHVPPQAEVPKIGPAPKILNPKCGKRFFEGDISIQWEKSDFDFDHYLITIDEWDEETIRLTSTTDSITHSFGRLGFYSIQVAGVKNGIASDFGKISYIRIVSREKRRPNWAHPTTPWDVNAQNYLSKPNVVTPGGGQKYVQGELTIEWDPLEGADHYVIKIEKIDGEKIEKNFISDTAHLVHDFSKGLYKISVAAVKNGVVGEFEIIDAVQIIKKRKDQGDQAPGPQAPSYSQGPPQPPLMQDQSKKPPLGPYSPKWDHLALNSAISAPVITKPTAKGKYNWGNLVIKWDPPEGVKLDSYLVQIQSIKLTLNYTTDKTTYQHYFSKNGKYVVAVSGVKDDEVGVEAAVGFEIIGGGGKPPKLSKFDPELSTTDDYIFTAPQSKIQMQPRLPNEQPSRPSGVSPQVENPPPYAQTLPPGEQQSLPASPKQSGQSKLPDFDSLQEFPPLSGSPSQKPQPKPPPETPPPLDQFSPLPHQSKLPDFDSPQEFPPLPSQKPTSPSQTPKESKEPQEPKEPPQPKEHAKSQTEFPPEPEPPGSKSPASEPLGPQEQTEEDQEDQELEENEPPPPLIGYHPPWEKLSFNAAIPAPSEIVIPKKGKTYQKGQLLMMWEPIEGVEYYKILINKVESAWKNTITSNANNMKHTFRSLGYYTVAIAGVKNGQEGESKMVDHFRIAEGRKIKLKKPVKIEKSKPKQGKKSKNPKKKKP